MKKLKITFEIDMTCRDSIRDVLVILRKYTQILEKEWKKMEVGS